MQRRSSRDVLYSWNNSVSVRDIPKVRTQTDIYQYKILRDIVGGEFRYFSICVSPRPYNLSKILVDCGQVKDSSRILLTYR